MKATDIPNSDKPPTRFDRKNALIGGIVLVVLIAAGITWVIVQRDKPKVIKAVPSTTITKSLQSKDGVTEQTLKDALDSNPTNSQKIQLLQLLANKAQQRGDLKTAVSYLVQAYDAGLKDPLLTENIGFLYCDQLHDNSQALKYLRISLQEVKGSSAAYAQNLTTTLNKAIKALEDQGVKAAN